MSIIKVEGLSKSFNYYEKEVGLKNSIANLFHRKKLVKDAVKDISFDLDEGEIVGFLGPNGAGKTTTLKMLSGIIYPTSGKANVLGYVPWERKSGFKKQFTIIMGQKSQLWWDLPANESFSLNKSIYEINDKEYKATLDELTELLDVKDLLKVQVRRLSLGERMKMELIAGLLHRPKVILLDEPTIGLDIIAQKKIRDFLKVYNTQHKATIILTSHYMGDIEGLCKRMVVINHGSIVFNSNISEIKDIFDQKKILKLQLSEYTNEDKISCFGKVKEFNGYTATIEMDKQDISENSKIILDSLPIVDFNVEDVPLEESIRLIYQKQDA